MSRISRRTMVKWLAAAPAIGAIEWSSAQTARAAEQLKTLVGEGAAPYAPKFFNRGEWTTVVLLVDYVIPRDERSGSATDAKVPEFMDWILADSNTSDTTRTAMRGGLAWLDLACEDRFGRPFAACTDAQRRELLDDIAWPKKSKLEYTQGAAFFSRFRDMTASGFFSSAMGWQDVQYLGNKAVAVWNGCPPAALEKLGVNNAMMDARPTRK
jgi:hypothetical protein